MFRFTSLFSALFLSVSLTAQVHNHSHLDHSNMRPGEDVEYCVTHKNINKLLSNPATAQQYIAAQNELELLEQTQNLNKAGTIYRVPIVFHVLHNGGPENISREQILDALFILNRDFRKQNTDANSVVGGFQSLVSDIEIEFELATKAPNGVCFSGITRTQSPLTIAPDPQSQWDYPGEHQVDAVMDGNDVYQGQWPSNKYLNVFICEDLGGAAGYTFNPTGGTNIFFNSVFMLHNYTGSIGTSNVQLSRALTHEVGHWLNLSHTWGPNNNPGNIASCNDDDGVNDTPNTIGVQGCVLNEASCGVTANVENYMDYSYCSKMFTTGQRTRMRTAMISSTSQRNNLWKTANLTATGATGVGAMCKADFSADQRVVCSGNSVHFTDQSYHSPSAWNWSFPGGTPSSSTIQNPQITYNTPGVYQVAITVSNSGGTVSQTKTQYIKVVSEFGIEPIQESFETVTSIPSTDWFKESSHTGSSWQISNNAAVTGSKSVMINNSQNSYGSKDELQSTTINLDLNLSASLSFKYAFAKKTNTDSDKLIVQVSNDCGLTWYTKKSISGSTLVTASNTSGNFIPGASEWETSTISSSSLSNFLTSGFRVKFVFENGGGNNIYLDDINIDGPVSIEESKSIDQLNVYPNPATSEVNISFVNKEVLNNFTIKIYDVIGKEIELINSNELSVGEHKYLINSSQYESGVYFIAIGNGISNKLHKFIIE